MQTMTLPPDSTHFHPRAFVVVVEALDEHLAAFRDLNLEWIDAHFMREAKDIEVLNDPVKWILEPGGQVFAALHDHLVVGVCAMMALPSSGEFELVKMAVRPDRRGLGAGRALMQAAEAWCLRQNAKRILIVTNSALTPAVRLYETSGYKLIHEGPHPSYQRADRIFEKRLG